jgi:AraC-like DNA-binding protein
MFNFKYQLSDLEQYASDLAFYLNVPYKNGIIEYPPNIANGYTKFVKLNEFVSIQIAHYTPLVNMEFYRQPSTNNEMCVTFMDFTFAQCKIHNYDCNEIIASNHNIGSIQCKSASKEEIVQLQPGTPIKVLMIFFKQNWEHNILKDAGSKEIMAKYVAHKDANFRKEYLNASQQLVFKELFDCNTSPVLEILFYQSKVFTLLESFFGEVIAGDNKDEALQASSKDVQMIQVAKTYLLEHINEPFIGVDELAKMCYMSRTKFINLFFKIYNLSSFNYYQKQRLQLAYDQLLQHNKSIPEIAESIGYNTVQNFKIAFQKEFGIEPKALSQAID